LAFEAFGERGLLPKRQTDFLIRGFVFADEGFVPSDVRQSGRKIFRDARLRAGQIIDLAPEREGGLALLPKQRFSLEEPGLKLREFADQAVQRIDEVRKIVGKASDVLKAIRHLAHADADDFSLLAHGVQGSRACLAPPSKAQERRRPHRFGLRPSTLGGRAPQRSVF
jgi:hypothetical protein